jgi:F0F1-type ATP synthase assembly protein I
VGTVLENKPGNNHSFVPVVTIAAQVGCLTFLIIIVALIAGLALDRWLQSLPLFTILLLVGSMPLSWVMVFWVVNRSKNKLADKPAGASIDRQTFWEDEDSDKDK